MSVEVAQQPPDLRRMVFPLDIGEALGPGPCRSAASAPSARSAAASASPSPGGQKKVHPAGSSARATSESTATTGRPSASAGSASATVTGQPGSGPNAPSSSTSTPPSSGGWRCIAACAVATSRRMSRPQWMPVGCTSSRRNAGPSRRAARASAVTPGGLSCHPRWRIRSGPPAQRFRDRGALEGSMPRGTWCTARRRPRARTSCARDRVATTTARARRRQLRSHCRTVASTAASLPPDRGNQGSSAGESRPAS